MSTTRKATGGRTAAEALADTQASAGRLVDHRDDREDRLRCLDLVVRSDINGNARELVASAEKLHTWVTGGASDTAKPPVPGATIESIARICHEVNRALQEAAGDQVSPPWDDAPDYQRESSMDGVRLTLFQSELGAPPSPEELHEAWRQAREADGWTYGDTKDESKKTHPCLVDYDDLPADQRLKDQVFAAIVAACAPTAQKGS